jgi:acetyl esterase/lipase
VSADPSQVHRDSVVARSYRRSPVAVLVTIVAAALILPGFGPFARSVSSRGSFQLPPAPGIRDVKDVVYAAVDGRALALDIALPAGIPRPPLLVWVHGGAWRSGDKDEVPRVFVERGFATASVNYRLSTEARFPAAVHDIKAAIRFLRARAADYGYRTDRIAIGGSSAGGHLAALVGVTNGHPVLEGAVGDNRSQSSDVHAILDYYGASDLTTILDQSTPFGLDVRIPALELWLGARPEQTKELAELASPVLHVDRADPPLLMFHGDRDPQMPVNQSHQLEGAYDALGLDVHLEIVHGAAHGGAAFFAPDRLERALAFLRRTID